MKNMTDEQYKVWKVWHDADQARCAAIVACFNVPSSENYAERERLEKVVEECRKDCKAARVPGSWNDE